MVKVKTRVKVRVSTSTPDEHSGPHDSLPSMALVSAHTHDRQC